MYIYEYILYIFLPYRIDILYYMYTYNILYIQVSVNRISGG